MHVLESRQKHDELYNSITYEHLALYGLIGYCIDILVLILFAHMDKHCKVFLSHFLMQTLRRGTCQVHLRGTGLDAQDVGRLKDLFTLVTYAAGLLD